MNDFDHLLTLPGEDRERRWLQKRLETLSVREGIVLTAAVQFEPPEDMAQAVNCLTLLDHYQIRINADSYAALGESFLRDEVGMPEDALPYVDLTQAGKNYENMAPGLFVGNCYVEYPNPDFYPNYRGHSESLPEDGGWSVRVKLASPAVPEGVWLRLPGQFWGETEINLDETLALQELRVQCWDECTLLDARCILPYAGDLMEQYDSVADLVYDGTELGYVLDEKGQGMPHFMERFAAALELEDCHDLRLALDISQNLKCYDWMPFDGPEGYAAKRLREAGVPDGLIHSGDIDLNGYGQHLLDEQGYFPASGDGGYIRRNSQEFHYRFSTPTPEQSGMTMQ